MKAIVVYSSRSGNTEKIAKEIASEIECPSMKITDDFDYSTNYLDKYDLVILGTNVRGGEPNNALQVFLKN
jgi:menaquinone-dependent protoporphyrinogen IX oxidase